MAITKRCNCRDQNGKTLGKKCPLLSKRDHGAFWVRYEAPRGPDGKRRRPWSGPYRTKTEAATAERRLTTGAESGAPVQDQSLTFGRYLREHWLRAKTGLKPSTRQSYQEIVDLYADPGLGYLRLAAVREHHLSELYEAMALINNMPEGGKPSEMLRRLLAARETAEWRGGGLHSSRPLSAARIHLAHRVLSSALGYAFLTRRIGYDPSKHVEPPRVTKVRPIVWTAERVERWRRTGHVPGPVMVWTPEQCGLFFDHCEDARERLFALFHLVATRGLRRQDVRRLEWPDIDLEGEGTFSIMQAADPSQGPKSEAGVRTAKLGAENVRLLKAWRQTQRLERLRAGEDWQESELVFTRRNGEPLRNEFASQRFRILIGRTGLPPIRFHDLRHCAATYGLAAGVDMKVISATLGHSKHSFTADTYTSVLPQLAEEAADATIAIIPRNPRRARG